MNNRKYYIDNLRWASILLLVPFHSAMAWNSWGEGNYEFKEQICEYSNYYDLGVTPGAYVSDTEFFGKKYRIVFVTLFTGLLSNF